MKARPTKKQIANLKQTSLKTNISHHHRRMWYKYVSVQVATPHVSTVKEETNKIHSKEEEIKLTVTET